MEKLRAVFEFIFSSYKRAALFLILGALILSVPILTTTRRDAPFSSAEVLGKTTTNNSLLAQAGQPCSASGGPIDGRGASCPAGYTCVSGGAGASSPSGTCVANTPDTNSAPNLYVNGLVLRRNAYPNANCSNGTVVTENMVLNVGETIEVCVNYGNNGTAAAGTYNIDNYLNQATKPANGTVGYQSYPIAGGTPVQGSSALQVGSIAPGANCTNGCKAGIFIDRNNVINESNENDNFATSVTYKVAATQGSCTVSFNGTNDTCQQGRVCAEPLSGSENGYSGTCSLLISKPLVCANYGDVDSDGNITQKDWRMTFSAGANRITLNDQQKLRTDVDADGRVGINDVMLIAQYVSGERSTFPVCAATPTCTPRPGGMDGFLTAEGTIGTTGVAGIPPPGSYCPNVGPTTSANSSISPVPIIANGVAEYKITLISTDPQGGNTIFRQYAAINEPNTGGAQRRGVVGWSAVGFEKYWGPAPGSFKVQSPALPYRCVSGGGAVAIYGGTEFGPQYINTRWCSTSVSGNTRTTEMYVSFNPVFTTPASNTLYGFTEDAGGLVDNWKSLQTFSLGPSCQYKAQGDANCDGKVNSTDYEWWKRKFENVAAGSNISIEAEDFNKDNKLNTDDFNIWRAGAYSTTIPH